VVRLRGAISQVDFVMPCRVWRKFNRVRISDTTLQQSWVTINARYNRLIAKSYREWEPAMSDDTQPKRDRPAQIDGPVARPPAKPQVQTDDLKVSMKRHPAPQWRSGDPVVIIEDMRERPQPEGS
jgi:hypothetical protein